MLRAAICDDEQVMLDYLYEHISAEFQRQGTDIHIEKFTLSRDFLNIHKAEPFDVVFLDIKMPDIDGFEVAKRVRGISEKTYMIFVTTESGLVYDSFDYHPFNFIPKGKAEILKAKLIRVISKLIEQLKDNYTICFDLPYGEKRYIKSSDIIYAVSKSNYLDIVCKTETIHIRRKLNEFLDELPSRSFARINNRIIVNMCCVCRIDNTRMKVTLHDGTELNISRTYKAEFSEKYNIYLRNYS